MAREQPIEPDAAAEREPIDHPVVPENGDRFRKRARDFLTAHTPDSPDDLSPDQLLDAAKRYQAALYDAGLAGITWPTEFGGQGLGAAEQQVFQQEAARFDLPTSPFTVGLGMCGPTLVDLGTAQQKSRFVPPLLRGDEIWCQLFSEPGAGSDVAGLQTRAVPDGDQWVITGQKVWTSGAQWSDFGALLVRTDPEVPKHRGLTMFVVDMRAAGVTVRPLRDMTGKAPFNEVYFDEVRVGSDAVLGEIGQGWAAAVTMLGHERVSIGGGTRPKNDPLSFRTLAELARCKNPTPDSTVRGALAELYAREQALELFNTRLRQEAEAGSPPGARGSVAKLQGALLRWRAVEVAGLIAGIDAVAWDADDVGSGELATAINAAPAASIAGGTNHVQRNIIGERILGLPKEPQVDRDVAFRDLRVGTQPEG